MLASTSIDRSRKSSSLADTVSQFRQRVSFVSVPAHDDKKAMPQEERREAGKNGESTEEKGPTQKMFGNRKRGSKRGTGKRIYYYTGYYE